MHVYTHSNTGLVKVLQYQKGEFSDVRQAMKGLYMFVYPI